MEEAMETANLSLLWDCWNKGLENSKIQNPPSLPTKNRNYQVCGQDTLCWTKSSKLV